MRVSASRVLLILALAVATFVALAVHADLAALTDRLGGFHWFAFVAAVGLAFVNYTLRVVRWQLYLQTRSIVVPLGPSILVFLSGFAMAITPGRVGEVIKCYLLRQMNGTPVTQSAPVVVAERVIDLLALVVIAVAGLAVYGVGGGVVLGAAMLLGVAFLGLVWQRLGRAVIALLTMPRALRRLRPRLDEFYSVLAQLLGPRLVAWSTVLTVCAWLAECLGFAVIVAAFPGADLPLGLVVAIYAVTLIAGALSFLPGGLGITEATMALLLVQSGRGMDDATAVAATLLMRLGTFWFSVVIGVVSLAMVRRWVRTDGMAPAVDR